MLKTIFGKITAHPFTKLVIKKMTERSSWRGVAAILATFGIVLSPNTVDLLFTTIIGLIGLWDVVKKEVSESESTDA